MTMFGENPGADIIRKFKLVDCVEKYIRRPWNFPIMTSPTFVTKILRYTSTTLYNPLTAVYGDVNKLSSNSMLIPFRNTSRLMDNF
jgi:hypothetical protein